MGIFCEMNLFKPSDTVYHPGQLVSGLIKYTLNKPMEVEKVTTSLKGIGCIILTDNPGSRYQTTYKTIEEILDIDTVIQDKKIEIPVGTHEIKFSYILPQNIPSSMKFRGYFRSHKAKCSIKYYIRIKFEIPGFLTFNKHFKKEINVISDVAPKLLREPVIYGETKKLAHLLSSKDSIVNIKATILNSALPFGGRILVQYEVQNNSHVIVKSIMTKLVRLYTFKAKGHPKVTFEEDVPNTEAKTTPVNCGDTRNMSIDINVPPYIYSLDNAHIVNRHYVTRIIAQLPIPHRNAVLNIPVQIGVLDENVHGNRLEWTNEDVSYSDAPPSYWEAMGETKKEAEADSDDEIDDVKLAK